MRLIMVMVVILSFFQVGYVYNGQPVENVSDYSTYLPSHHVWLDKIAQLDGWTKVEPRPTSEELANLVKQVPERKVLVIRAKLLYCRLEEQQQRLALLAVGAVQKKVKPFFVHCAPSGSGYDPRFDTVMMPNGTVAVLNGIARDLGYDSSAIDESYPGPNLVGRERAFVLNQLMGEIEKSLSLGLKPVVYCTLLSYNSESSLRLLKTLKDKFGKSLRTGVGGQLVQAIPKTYLTIPFIDQVGVGDAEAILQSMLTGQKYAKGWVNPSNYGEPCYHNYLGLADRLQKSSQYVFGPFTNIRQLCVESVRGCSWAHATGRRCEMCALQGVTDKPVFRSFRNHFDLENRLAKEFGINWLFDVSNQFIPVVGEGQQARWLRTYLDARNKCSDIDIDKYVYLTASSVTSKTAPLLREAGVRIAYIGFDGWDSVTRKALHKPNINPVKTLAICKRNGIYVRASFVVGAGLTNDSLHRLPELVGELMTGYSDIILSCGTFLQIIIPGSPAWETLQVAALKNGWEDVNNIYNFLHQNGFLTWEQEEGLTKSYIQQLHNMDYDEVVAVRDSIKATIESKTIAITIRDGGTLPV